MTHNIHIRLDVPYGGGARQNLCVDVYSPASTGPHPALLCLHGGAWQRGTQRLYSSWGPWLAQRGYAVIAVDYRLSSDISPAWPGVWHDVRLSLDWLIANATSLNIDRTRIAAIGDSAGGHMSAMLSLNEKTAPHIRAVIGIYGVYDLPDWWRVTQPPRRADNPVVKLMGWPYPQAREDYENFSPLHRVQQLANKPSAKYLIIHGDQDAIVHHDQSERFAFALRDKGAFVETMFIPGAAHHWFTWEENNPGRRRAEEEPNATVAPELLRFLAQHLA